RQDEARFVGCQHDIRKRIEIGELQLSFDDADQPPYASLGIVAGAQGGRKCILVEHRRGPIWADVGHRHATLRLSPASGRRSKRKNMASFRLSAIRAAFSWRARAATGSISSSVACFHKPSQRSNSSGVILLLCFI